MWDMTQDPEVPRREVAIGVGEDLSPKEVLRKALQVKVPQIIQKNTLMAEEEKETSILLYRQTSVLFEYPLSVILRPDKVTQEQEEALAFLDVSVSSSAQKKATLDTLEGHLQGLTKATLIPDVRLVADELLSNAIYNAPFTDLENQSPGASRVEGEVASELPARLLAGHDGDRLVVACFDQYGTLNVEKLIARIQSCYHTGAAANMNRTTEGGAKIGSYLIFQSCLSYYAAVEPGVRTLVAATFPLLLNRRKRESLTKNLHIFKL